jgi:TolB-like protein/Tfp pilus assembly protein PilF
MGQVWKAHDTRLDRIVAIKTWKGSHSGRFQQEARAIAALNHPHICNIYDVGPNYLVLEHLDGQPLAGPQAVGRALTIARQIAGALEAAHRRGILHRDLKPANVVVTESGAKLLDFGLAKLTTGSDHDANRTIEGTIDGTVMGTAAYMSPEQARGLPVDARSDIFSFGAVLYEVLSGRPAFARASLVDTLNAVLTDEPAPLDSPLAALVSRCLVKDAARRYQSATELAEALAAIDAHAVTSPSAAAGRTAIAVLPFASMTREVDDEYFSDGLAEEIINALARVPGLKVIARTSAFAFKGQNTDVRKIASVLGVSYVLEGSVRRSTTRIRVAVQLIDASDGSQLWAERFDRQMEDLFALQDEIAAAIAGELKLKFGLAARPRRQPDLKAYEAYLRYRQYQWAFTPEALVRSRECLEQAIALDPGFALPLVGLADNCGATIMAGAPPIEAMATARGLAERALALDPELPEAHGYLGLVAGMYDHDWQEADRRFRLATATDPIPWHVLAWQSIFYFFPTGQHERALHGAQRVLEDNPLSQITYWNLAVILDAMGRADEALIAHRRSVELDPMFWLGWYQLGAHLLLRGDIDGATTAAERARALFPVSPHVAGLLAALAATSGDLTRAHSELQKAAFGEHLARAEFFTLSGRYDDAVDAAIAVVEGRDPFFVLPFMFERQLRASARWPELQARLNLGAVPVPPHAF